MIIRICLTSINDQKAILRGSPENVDHRIEFLKGDGKEVEVLGSAQDEANSAAMEHLLWVKLISDAKKINEEKFVFSRYQIWLQKSSFIWLEMADPGYLCIMTDLNEEMIASIEKHEPMTKQNYG